MLAHSREVVDARWRLQGTERILTKPLLDWLVENRLSRAWNAAELTPPDRERVIAVPPRTERLTTPHPSAPFGALLVDLDEEVHEQLRWCFRGEARHVMRRDPEEAAALALSTPFHLVAISANAAVHPLRSFLDGIGRAAVAERVLVFAPARDVPYVRHKLAELGPKNLVLPIHIEDATLRRAIFRAHPALEARVAEEEAMEAMEAGTGAAPRIEPPRFRRQAVLVVDDHATTAVLFAPRDAWDDAADVAFVVATPMDALEHVVERSVDRRVVSATMRGDGGEAFYRVLWRLAPALKHRSVLVTSDAPSSSSRRVVERPLRARLARVGATKDAGAVFAQADLALHLVRVVAGPELASRVMRYLLINERRGQPPPAIDKLVADDELLRAAERWAMTELEHPFDIPSLARAVGTSPRTLARRTDSILGTTPGQWVRMRVEEAARLLQSTHLPVTRVAERAGFGSVASLRREVQLAFGLSPRALRETTRAG